MQSKKPNILGWPYKPKNRPPGNGKVSIEEVKAITEEWRRQRQAYPGWLILPHGNRENLWVYTRRWIHYLREPVESQPGLDIKYAFELIWRLERCLLPVFDNIAEFCDNLLEKYWPFQNIKPPANYLIHPWEERYRDLPWIKLQQAWLAIALAMLRYYREEGVLDKWEEAENRLKLLSDHLTAEQREFLHYEGFLFSLFTLELPKAKQRLENWRPNEAHPYWMVKRAAGLAEIGLVSEAETVVKNALENVRKKLNQKVGVTDISLVSLESNAMLLGKYIQDASALKKDRRGIFKEERTQFNDRWNELKGFNCDPWIELKLFEQTLKNPPVESKSVTEKSEFDIGRISIARHFHGADQEALMAYSFLRFCEEVGLPYQVGNLRMARETASASLQRIAQYSPFWAMATLTRLGDEKVVDSLFNRESVYKFTAGEADQLIQNYLDALEKCRDDIHAGDAFHNQNFAVRLAQLLPEIISRLCCKCSGKTKRRVLDFVTGIYASPDKTSYQNVKNLTRRLISSMSEMEQYNLVPDLLKIPFPEALDLRIEDDYPNPFLLLDFNQKPEGAPTLGIQTGLVDDLFRQAGLDNSDRRRWAISSLVTLYNLQLLDDSQSKNLAEAIWRVTDDKYGLPDGTDFYKFAFLELPHPVDVDPAQLFKNYIESEKFPIQKNLQDKGIRITGGDIPIVREIIGAEAIAENFWAEEEAAEMLKRLLEWWDKDKERLHEDEPVSEFFSSIPEEFRARFARMLKLVAKVVGPRLCIDSPDENKTSLSRLLREVRESGLPCLEAEAACLHIYPDQKTDVYNRISEALISNEVNIKKDGLRAIAIIIMDGKDSAADSGEAEPVSMLSQYLTWSPMDSISSALLIIYRILQNVPASFSRSLEVATQRRLDRLLADTAYDNDNIGLTFDEKLEVRRFSSTLAAALWKYYNSQSLSIPEVIGKWRETCLSPDEFSEIRNPWEDCDRV